MERRVYMAIDQNRMKSLKSKHDSLEAEIAKENSRPAPDSARLQELKRQKLKVKEELEAGKKV